MDLSIFLDLAKWFEQFGKKLYMIGGTSRDFLLGREIEDFDLVTDAIPSDLQTILPDADFTFSHYGTIRLKRQGKRVDIVTLREETLYKDHRHPSSVSFVSDIEKDFPRRDFTINALYIDETLAVHDFANGKKDLDEKLIRTIGEPNKRFQEDPLRMLRALRFQLKLGFEIEPATANAIKNNWDLLGLLQPAKVNEELAKLRHIDPVAAEAILNNYPEIKSEHGKR